MPRPKKTEGGKAAVKKGNAKQPLAKPLPVGTVLKDMKKSEWILGRHIGQGGFGLIYAARRASDGGSAENHVVKIEPLSNGPLFCEIHFYRNVKLDQVPEWMKKRNIRCLGIPRDVTSGNFNDGSTDYRFLVMDRFGEDLQSIFERQKRHFSAVTAFTIGLKVIDVLEYIHGMGYVHADLKAANILRGRPPNEHEVFVVDFGLAYRFCRDGNRTVYREDPKRRHDGTLEFCSRDAHKGVSPAPRGDFETLGFCMLQWVGGALPWESLLGATEKAKDSVAQMKEQLMTEVKELAVRCNAAGMPDFIKFLEAVAQLKYDENIDYEKMKKFLLNGIRQLGGNAKDLKVTFGRSSPKRNTSANGSTARKRPQASGDAGFKNAPPAASGPRSPRSPRTPRSPRSPRTPRSPRSARSPEPSCSPAAAKRQRPSSSPLAARGGTRTPLSPRETACQTSPSLLLAAKLQRRRQKQK